MLQFIFVERCRVCRTFINYKRDGRASVCLDCWMIVWGEAVIVERCPVASDFVDHIIVASGTRYAGSIKSLVYKLKYDNDILIARDLSELLERAWLDLLPLFAEEPVLVPVPLHWWRLMKRGYNQSELLSQHLSKRIKVKSSSQLLARKRSTRAHHGLKRSERMQNIQGAFAANAAEVSNKSIVLVDDIYTSGATLAEAAQILLNAGCREVFALTVARATLADR